MSNNIVVPGLGSHSGPITVFEWKKKPRDYVRKDEVVAELHTDKVAVEVVSGFSGWLGYEYLAYPGQQVKSGDTIGVIVDERPRRLVKLRAPTGNIGISKFTARFLFEVGQKFKEGDKIVEYDHSDGTLNVVAPFDGEIGFLNAESGDTVHPEGILGVLVQQEDSTAEVPTDTQASPVETKRTIRLLAKTPDPSEEFSTIIWNFDVGDEVAKGQVIFTLSSDKKSLQIKAPFGGRIKEKLFQSNDLVKGKEAVALFEQL
jgi:pyruvate/2-oxoglutarate dehydrogenase complex dihydrolipoamide acyltransferase (E2) component